MDIARTFGICLTASERRRRLGKPFNTPQTQEGEENIGEESTKTKVIV